MPAHQRKGALWPGFGDVAFVRSPAGLRDELIRCIRLTPGFKGTTVRGANNQLSTGIAIAPGQRLVTPILRRNLAKEAPGPGRPRNSRGECPLKQVVLNTFASQAVPLPRHVAPVLRAVVETWKRADRRHQAKQAALKKQRAKQRVREAMTSPVRFRDIRSLADHLRYRLDIERRKCPKCTDAQPVGRCGGRHRTAERWVLWWENHLRKKKMADAEARRHVRLLLRLEGLVLPPRRRDRPAGCACSGRNSTCSRGCRSHPWAW